MTNSRSTRLLIKVISNKYGSKMCTVDPNHCISTLKDNESEEHVFIFKGQMLADNFTFKHYRISDGDIICSLIGYTTPLKQQELHFEKLRMQDMAINKLYGNQNLYKKVSAEWIRIYETKLAPISLHKQVTLKVPERLKTPSNISLPAFWNK
ncbi:hypothetical protein TVAG_303850 [Trichomonas vaginalis G3]|uniref:Ubiquitin-like domain-containing protein n=1 Tax=Trichomonas vaginalis (strain ATCC PRA-98 / G3) TaxID=412133 RepID=A2DR66_TRIV3|nr:ubiquitin-like family [Trichomonas vaginalis G3]EAY17165.1 hypothetical protein TVAG_303850 [Trichomonas vaginalis G3]KAI5508895.1 ubiquitin-like family [Trichomonas vaginalis G3]|eukprot:XP_001329388.1 hypothetical protein [Trichomonas vaginalis G3]